MKKKVANKQHRTVLKNMTDQLREWSLEIDNLITGSIRAGAYSHDEYRLRLDHLRQLLSQVQSKVDTYTSPDNNEVGGWTAFRAEIKSDWGELSLGFKDVTQSPPVA